MQIVSNLADFTPGPFSIPVSVHFYLNHSPNSNHPGVEQLYSQQWLTGVAASQKPDDYWNVVTSAQRDTLHIVHK